MFTWFKPFVRRYLKPLRKIYWDMVVWWRRGPFLKYGLDALRIFHETAEDYGIKYTLAFGSVLGAIREHGFIKYDLDIDTFMCIDDLNNSFISSLLERGFKWYCCYSISGDKLGREDTFVYKGCHLDVFYLYKINDETSYCCDFVSTGEDHSIIPRRIILPLSGLDRRLERFESLMVYVPKNAEEFCEYRYGPTYMVPDKTWTCRNEIDCIMEWPEVAFDTIIKRNPSVGN